MLCPEIWNFPAPKVITSCKKDLTFEDVSKVVQLNNFYKSAIITCPDELHTPQDIEEALIGDTDYYKVTSCPISEFLDPIFIEKFVRSGELYCLSYNTNCVVENCFAITPDGILTLHTLENLYQTLGIEGTKRPHNYYEINICLKDFKNIDRLKNGLSKIKAIDFMVSWVPAVDNVCPSSIAKYFFDRNFNVSSHSLTVQRLTPKVNAVPSLHGSDIEEIVEWVGMLAHGADISPVEGYISTYTEPECTIKTSRISVFIVKGFITTNIVLNSCKRLSDYVQSRELEQYWASISVQSIEESLWQWNKSSPRMFQSQNASCNIFFSEDNITIYSIGQLKYS